MENKMDNAATSPASSSLHPLLWIAGISVTLLSIVGIASITGFLPGKSAPALTQPLTLEAVPATPPPAVTAPAAAVPPEATPAAPAAPAAAPPPHKAAKAAVKHAPTVVAGGPPAKDYGVPPDYVPPPAVTSVPAAPPCPNCGVIADIRQVTHEGQGSGLGAIAGGVVGGALGNNVGRGNGRTLATIAGAVGGGLLGNKIEKSQRQTVGYQVSVRMEDGSTQSVDSATVPPWRIGDHVKLVNGSIVSR